MQTASLSLACRTSTRCLLTILGLTPRKVASEGVTGLCGRLTLPFLHREECPIASNPFLLPARPCHASCAMAKKSSAGDYAAIGWANLRKLGWHTGKAAWIAGTTILILGVPLILEMDREQQLLEFESQQLGALTGPAK